MCKQDPSAPDATVLEQVGWVADDISWPRGMSLSPSERHLIVANERGRFGNHIVVFDRDDRTGMLRRAERVPPIPCPAPQCIDWVA